MTVGGVQVDCPATKGLYQNHDPWEDSWGLDKDVRLRLWPAGSRNLCEAGKSPATPIGLNPPLDTGLSAKIGLRILAKPLVSHLRQDQPSTSNTVNS
jgi:hypothetical protein